LRACMHTTGLDVEDCTSSAFYASQRRPLRSTIEQPS
jgi:hypothetical protein